MFDGLPIDKLVGLPIGLKNALRWADVLEKCLPERAQGRCNWKWVARWKKQLHEIALFECQSLNKLLARMEVFACLHRIDPCNNGNVLFMPSCLQRIDWPYVSCLQEWRCLPMASCLHRLVSFFLYMWLARMDVIAPCSCLTILVALAYPYMS